MEYSGLLLLLSLAFVTARASAIASFCSFGAFVGCVLRIVDDGWRKGCVADFIRVQHTEARAILAAAAAQQERGSRRAIETADFTIPEASD